MARGVKTGGRVAGTPNKNTSALERQLAALGCDPIEGMAKIAMDETKPADLRGRMYAELASYIHAKRKAIELSNDPDKPLKMVIEWMKSSE